MTTARTLRVRQPEETVERMRPYFGDVGITRVADLTGLDVVGIPVLSAIRPNARSLSVSQGKGATYDAAMASAVMESIEYWHAERPSCQLRYDSWHGLVGEMGPDAIIDVERLPRRGSLDGLDAFSPRTRARARFDPHLPSLWVEATSLYTGSPCWTPFETVHLNKVGYSYETATFRVSSNGLASGNTEDEALLHALCELVERDAVARWWTALRSSRDIADAAVDVKDLEDDLCSGLVDTLAAAGVRLALLDISSPHGLPVFQACLLDQKPRPYGMPLGPCWGYGAHPFAEVAAARAITEAAQTRVTSIAGAREDNFVTHYRRHHGVSHRRATERLFFGCPAGPVKPHVCFDGSSAGEGTQMVLRELKRHAVGDIVAVDLSRLPGVAVTKVIAPGLRHFSAFRDLRESGQVR